MTEATDTLEAETAEPTIKRRTIIKGAAWSLPVIAAAVATPLAAASDPVVTAPANLKWDTWRNNYTDDGHGNIIGVRTGVQIQNSYWSDDSRKTVSGTTSVVTVQITYPAGVVTDASSGAAQLTGAGWSLNAVTTNGDGSVTYTLLYSSPIPASSSSNEANLSVPAKKVTKAAAIGICFADNAATPIAAPAKGNSIKG